ncbi:4817_t:CDS:2 [Entrophospora sp. SA101]|nr:4817_t:CDS:2 [Entrophospora sp. SA101]
MPKQSKRNQHLQKACETKKLKIIEPITDEYIDKEVFENESRLEIEDARRLIKSEISEISTLLN